MGLIVDGESEYRALPALLRRVPEAQLQLVQTLRAPISPYANAAVIANSCRSAIQIICKLGIPNIIILLDREARDDCPGQWATEISAAISLPSGCRASVVIKDRMFENWLIADVTSLRTFPGRYTVTPAVERRIVPNKADSCNAMELMKALTQSRYEKVSDSKKILAAADPMRIADNSRSFRRMMRVMESQSYRTQSKNPA
jgi:Domain of unknown function (DUF4276)